MSIIMELIYQEEHSNPFELERPDYLDSSAKAKPVKSPLVSPDFHRMSENAQQIYLMMGAEYEPFPLLSGGH